MGRNKRDITSQAFAVTNFTEDLAFDANTSTLADTSDVLATVINELIAQGILSGTVSA
jgi:hypothetical protein